METSKVNYNARAVDAKVAIKMNLSVRHEYLGMLLHVLQRSRLPSIKSGSARWDSFLFVFAFLLSDGLC